MLIGELAALTGASPRALRYYEQQGLLSAKRSANGYRRYPQESVLQVRQIRALLDAGFSSVAVAQLLPCARGENPTIELCPQVAARMRSTLQDLDDELRTLGRRRERVAALLRHPTAG